jgi:hypothetical protein
MTWTRNRALKRAFLVLVLLALGLEVFGCIGVRGRRRAPEKSGFLGDYSQLEERDDMQAQLAYLNPRADWSRYDAIQIESVTLWRDDETAELGEEERQMIADLLYKALHEKLGQRFAMAERTGPSVLQMRAAVTQAKGANIATRTISTYVPVGLVLSTATGLSADTASTVGSATLEAEVLDSVTRERLAAVVDSRAGTRSLVSGRTFTTWGDVESACNFWAERAAAFFLRVGVQPKPGAAAN